MDLTLSAQTARKGRAPLAKRLRELLERYAAKEDEEPGLGRSAGCCSIKIIIGLRKNRR